MRMEQFSHVKLYLIFFFSFFCIKNKWRLYTTYSKREVPLKSTQKSLFWEHPNILVSHTSTLPECLRKANIGTTPIQKPNLKAPHACKASKANAKIMFFTANLRKLRFYQNKGLSLDRHCGVPNTLSASVFYTLG